MRYTFILMMSFISFLSKAQTKFSIQAGTVSTNNYISHPSNFVPSFQNYLSFDIGVLMKQGLYKKINSESGIFYNQKGYKFYDHRTVDYTSYGHYHVNYLTVNQNFTYNFFTIKNLIITTGLGGFFGKGISGSFVADTYDFGNHQYTGGKISFGHTTNDRFQSWDGGLNFLLRLGYKKFDVTAMFSKSLTNHIPKASQQNIKETFQSGSFNLGYNF